MGNHGAASARARTGTASNRARNSTDVNSGGPRALNLSNWPVSRRLFAVIVMALLMGLVFGGLRVASAQSSAAQFGRASQLANLGEQVTGLIQALQNERDVTAVAITNNNTTKLTPLFAATDAAAANVQSLAAGIGSGFPANIQADASAVLQDVSPSSLATLHKTYQSSQDVLAVIATYGTVISNMITLSDQIAQGVSDAALVSDVRTLSALSLAKEQASQERAILYNTFSTVQTDFNTGLPQVLFGSPGLPTVLNNAFAAEVNDEATFRATATPAEASLLGTELAAQPVSQAQQLEDYVLGHIQLNQFANGLPTIDTSDGAGFPQVLGSTPSLTLNVGNAARKWFTLQSAKIDAMQATEQNIAGNIVARAQSLQSGAQQTALITIIITVVVLLLVLIAALLVARSLVLPLRRLRAGALDVATVQLPERVKQLSEAPDPTTSLEVAPIDVLTEDEIGQVARAFDQVHAEAVRLAGNEALLRTSFNAMFVNLSRRSQSLIERLARMIDSLEQNEDDPDRLSNLFSMDHLVTRMRRNSENLLLLAGHEGARKWSESVSLADVARAATSEIEQYNRVVLNIQPGVAVIGQAVSDAVHLLAELVENATLFSPKDTQVQVSAQELSSGGVLIEIADKGIGVSEARLTEMNWRLDNSPVMDVSVSRHMGLFAVARLAERHRIRVRLRPASPQGLIALVWLPDSVIERTNRVYGGTGGWQPIAAQGGFQGGGFQARRVPGQFLGNGGNGPQAVGQPSYGRHSLGTRTAMDDSPPAIDRSADIIVPGTNGYDGASLDETAQSAAPPTSASTSTWFRSRRTSPGGGTGSVSRPPGNGTGNGNDAPNAGARPFVGSAGLPSRGSDAGTGGWPTARNPGDIAADPVRGEETSAGLPMRVPKANLIPGSAGGGRDGGGNARAASRPGSSQEAQTLSAPLPQRSPDMARSRLSGFQRGARRAEGQPPRAGEGTDR
jgi:signal transduction histidine kinase